MTRPRNGITRGGARIIAIAALAAVLAIPSYAQAAPHKKSINCGWPHPDAACSGTLPVAPVAPVTPAPANAPAKDIFSGLLQFQGQVVSDLQQADATQAAVINPATGASWDPFSHMCLAGVPASGTQGQPGYIPASPGLIAWVQSLAPMAVSAVPPLPASPSAATLAVHARLLIMAAEGDANSLLNQINSGGVPQSLRIACGSLINDGVNQVGTIGMQAAAFEALLGKYVMPILAASKHS